MKDGVELFVSEDLRDLIGSAKIDIVHRDLLCDRRNIRALDLRIVKIVKIVEDRDTVSVSE